MTRIVMWYRKSKSEEWDFWGFAKDEEEVERSRRIWRENPRYEEWEMFTQTVEFPKD